MDDDFFKIKVDQAFRLIEISFRSTFWEAGVADRFMASCAVAKELLHCPSREILFLVDLTGAVIQSQETIEKMQAFVGQSVARRIALVASSPLARMQTKRLQVRSNVILFDRAEEALAWLLSPSSSTVAA